MHLIVNPAAAGGRLGRTWPSLHQRLRDLGLDAEVSLTRAPGHAADLAAEAATRGAGVVVAVGGDGTICETVQGLVRVPQVALGILPLGTGNDAARTLGIPLIFDAAARSLLAGHRQRVDLIRAGDRVVLNAIGIGLLGAINVNASDFKLVRGIAAYLAAAVTTMFRFRAPEVEVVSNGFRYAGPLTILAVHNGPTTGGGFRLTPAAVVDDGLGDACLVGEVGIAGRVPRLVGALQARLGRMPGSHELRFERLELRTATRIPWHWDGNPAWIEPPGMTFEIVPAALEVVTPGGG